MRNLAQIRCFFSGTVSDSLIGNLVAVVKLCEMVLVAFKYFVYFVNKHNTLTHLYET